MKDASSYKHKSFFRDQSNLLYSYSLRKTVQRAFSLPTLGELERELLLELAMVVLINVGMSLYETSQVCLTEKKKNNLGRTR